MDASTQGWGAHMGDSQISGTWTHSERKLHIFCLGLKAVILGPPSLGYSIMGPPSYDRYRINTQDPFPHPVMSSSGSVYMATKATNSRHSYQGQTHSGLSDRDSGLSISTNLANNIRVESPPRNGEPNFSGHGELQQWTCLPHSTTCIFLSLCLQFWSLEHWR